MRRATLVVVMMVVALLLGSGVALAAVKYGTEGRDVLVGTKGEDVLYGRGGNDGLAGRGADDVLYGGDGNDFMYGGSVRFREIFKGGRLVADGEDKLFGGKGDDCVFGGTQDDILYGGDGHDLIGLFCNDFISDGGEDVMYGGSGNDEIIALEVEFPKQQRDIVFCGPGKDTVYYQKGVDRIFGCERRNPR